jgi:hypothetical protein
MDWQGLLITVAVGLAAVAVMWLAYLYAASIKDSRLRKIVTTFVAAAEQIYKDNSGQTKLDWVFGELRKQYPRLDANLLRAMIEQAVLSIKRHSADNNILSGVSAPPASIFRVYDDPDA